MLTFDDASTERMIERLHWLVRLLRSEAGC